MSVLENGKVSFMEETRDTSPAPVAESDIADRLEGVPDRLAKEALDEIVRLRWSLKTSQNVIDRLTSVSDSRTPTVQLTSSELSAIHFFATYGAPAHRAGTLRGLLERIK